MTVLVTGFGPFPDVSENLSARIAECLCMKLTQTFAELLILDTNWQTAPAQVSQRLRQVTPDAIIHLGVSDSATGLTLEAAAYNQTCDTPDATGACCDDNELALGCSASLETTAPLVDIESRLRESDIPFIRSDDPGRYLCNAVYYTSLNHIQTQSKTVIPCIFVHIPVAFCAGTVPEHDILKGLGIVYEAMIAG